MLKGALTGAVGGALFGGINYHYVNEIRPWTFGRVVASGVAGGITSEVGGGSFRDGFLIGSVIAGARWGWERMRTITNELKFRAINSQYSSDPERLNVNIYGEYDTTGGRSWDTRHSGYTSWLGNNFGMNLEGRVLENGFSKPFPRFINWTSKVHDFFNSWRYTDQGLFLQFQSQIGAELFEIYSFSGMLPAAAYTAVAQYCQRRREIVKT